MFRRRPSADAVFVSLKRINLEPTDTLVIEIPHELAIPEVEKIKHNASALMGIDPARVAVLTGGAKLTAIVGRPAMEYRKGSE